MRAIDREKQPGRDVSGKVGRHVSGKAGGQQFFCGCVRKVNAGGALHHHAAAVCRVLPDFCVPSTCVPHKFVALVLFFFDLFSDY